jgi:small subunit ribosomal protein S6
MASIQNRYEIIMVFSVQQGEDTAKALVEKFKALIADNSTIDSEEDWGKRRLAYPIQDELDGYYYLIHFTAAPDFPAELDRVLKITDGVLRSLIVRMDEEEPAKAKKEEPVAATETATITTAVAETVAATETATITVAEAETQPAAPAEAAE